MATIQPQLDAGLDTGWDMIVLTDYMAARLIDRKLDRGHRPGQGPERRRQPASSAAGPTWDPDQTYHYPYQTFADGVGYNRVSTGQDLMSTAELVPAPVRGQGHDVRRLPGHVLDDRPDAPRQG